MGSVILILAWIAAISTTKIALFGDADDNHVNLRHRFKSLQWFKRPYIAFLILSIVDNFICLAKIRICVMSGRLYLHSYFPAWWAHLLQLKHLAWQALNPIAFIASLIFSETIRFALSIELILSCSEIAITWVFIICLHLLFVRILLTHTTLKVWMHD